MDSLEALRRCGGWATWGQLKLLGVSRTGLRNATDLGLVVRSRRGVYRVAALDAAPAAALQVAGALSHRSAAAHYGWSVATAPERPEVVVRRNRNLPTTHHSLVHPRWRKISDQELRTAVTSPVRTVLDCARDLPFAEALAVADSALRSECVSVTTLRESALQLKGPGSAKARKVAQHANGMAANAFESVVRAHALMAGLDVQPQVQVAESGLWAMVDLADQARRLAIEAESYEHHGTRRGFRKDVRRYTELVVFGWQVLRVTWEDVMIQPRYVQWVFESWRRRFDDGAGPGAPPEHLPRLA